MDVIWCRLEDQGEGEGDSESGVMCGVQYVVWCVVCDVCVSYLAGRHEGVKKLHVIACTHPAPTNSNSEAATIIAKAAGKINSDSSRRGSSAEGACDECVSV